jgi:hypothetical protein
VMNNISILNTVLGVENTKKSVIPILQSIKTEKQWRIRLSFVEFLP